MNSPAYAEWLDDVLHALQVERAILLGLSQGTWVALKYAIEQPHRVEKLVLLSPGGVFRDKMSFVFRALFYLLLGKWGCKRLGHMLHGDQPVSVDAEEMTTIFIRNFRPRMDTLPIFSNEELQRLTMPVLLLGGTKDALRDIESIVARLRKFMPQLRVVIVPGAGHAIVQDTAMYILPFVKGVNYEA